MTTYKQCRLHPSHSHKPSPKLGSLFDGSGGFPLAASMCGIEPVWAAEVEPYPIAVTRSRFPNMKHLGSVTEVNGAEIEPVDIVSFGAPCQDLSVAGRRAGLRHEGLGDEETTRSGLFMEAIRIIKEMREATNGEYPRFAIYENVPGAFSSSGGNDWKIVLEELIKIVEPTAVMPEVPKGGWPYADVYCGEGWSLSYRVVDAQHFGVPQRRRRVYAFLDLRGQCAGKVSFEREGLRGYFETGRTPWQETAGDAEGGVGAADREGKHGRVNVLNPWDSQGNQVHDGTNENIYPTLRGCGGAGYQQGYVLAETGAREGKRIINLNKDDVQSKAVLDPSGIAPALYAGECRYGGGECYVLDKEHPTYAIDQQGGKGNASYAENIMPTLCSDSHGTPHAVAYSFDSLASNSMKSSNPNSGCRLVEVSKCLDTSNPDPSKNQGGIAIVEPIPYTLKIRSGCEGGGKGALIQTDKSATLSTLNDQYLFQPIAFSQNQRDEVRDLKGKAGALMGEPGMKQQTFIAYPDITILDDQGGQQINVRTDGKCPTLRAEMHGNVPCVMETQGLDIYNLAVTGDVAASLTTATGQGASNTGPSVMVVESAGFKAGQSKAGGIGWQKECAATLAAECSGTEPTVCIKEQHLFENHAQDSRYKGPLDVCPMLPAQLGTGGNNQPFVVEGSPVYCLQGNGIDRADTAGCNGKGWKEDTSYTLNTIDRPAVAYGLETFHCSSEEEQAPTLKARDWKDPHVVAFAEPIVLDRAYFNQGANAQYDPQLYEDGTVPTLVARGPSAVCHSDVAGVDCRNATEYPEMTGTLQHDCYKNNNSNAVVRIRYIVRRLTPTECARLQGFPDKWGHPDAKDSFTDAEYAFWLNVRNTHATINGKATKEYTREQMLTWYNKLHTDSAEYKLWGNGIALPCALYFMLTIKEVLDASHDER